jgi:GAF domain-containing protein
MLEQMTQRLLAQRTFDSAVAVILNDVVDMHGAEYGDLQLTAGPDLVIVAQRGLSAPFLRAFRRVSKDDGCACGRAFRSGQPVVIADVERDPEYEAFRNDAMRAGFRAVQSTPLVAGDGVTLGIVSTLFANVHEPTPIEMDALKAYSRLAAEHLGKLLAEADETLSDKAETMSRALYACFDPPEDAKPAGGERPAIIPP